MKKAFDLVNNTGKLKSNYFYASRRSIIVPSLCDCKTVEELFSSFTLPGQISLKSLLKRIGLEDDNLQKLLRKYNLEDVEKKYEQNIIMYEEKFKSFFNEILPPANLY